MIRTLAILSLLFLMVPSVVLAQDNGFASQGECALHQDAERMPMNVRLGEGMSSEDADAIEDAVAVWAAVSPGLVQMWTEETSDVVVPIIVNDREAPYIMLIADESCTIYDSWMVLEVPSSYSAAEKTKAAAYLIGRALGLAEDQVAQDASVMDPDGTSLVVLSTDSSLLLLEYGL